MAGHATRLRHAWGLSWQQAWTRPAAMAGFAVLTAAAAWVRVPLPGTPVPLTLQLLPVLLAGAAMGRAWGAASMGLYLVLGWGGLPFFAQCAGGAGLGFLGCPTAGYLAGFPLAAWLVGWLAQGRGTRGTLAAMMAGVLGIYALGAAHLALVLHVDLGVAVLLGVLPFVAADAAKAGAAAVLTSRARAALGG